MELDHNSERIEIPLSKLKLTITLIGAIAFVAAGIWFVINPEAIAASAHNRRPVGFILGLGVVSILFFGTCAFFIAIKLFDKKPGLIIDNTGIYINNFSKMTYIAWNEISDLGERRVKSTRFLMVYLHNPEAYIQKETKYFKRMLMSANHKAYNSPVSITANGLKCKFDELYSLIEHKLKR